MPHSEHVHQGRARRSPVLLLAAGLAAIAITGSAAEAGGASAATCASGDAEPDHVSPHAIAGATLCLINAERHGRGLAPLRLSRPLSDAARRHSADMVRRRYFSHTAPGGSGLLQRIRRSGYLHSAGRWRVGENLAWGTPGRSSPRATVRAWMDSPPHRRAILTPSYRDAGIGVVPGIPSPQPAAGATYTVDFGVKQRTPGSNDTRSSDPGPP
jgi:uncharacterized protein YkwD